MARRRLSPLQRNLIALACVLVGAPLAWYGARQAADTATQLAYYQRSPSAGFAQQVQRTSDTRRLSPEEIRRRLALEREHSTWLMLTAFGGGAAGVSLLVLLWPLGRVVVESGSRRRAVPDSDDPSR